jgi:hypothetical protein
MDDPNLTDKKFPGNPTLSLKTNVGPARNPDSSVTVGQPQRPTRLDAGSCNSHYLKVELPVSNRTRIQLFKEHPIYEQSVP